MKIVKGIGVSPGIVIGNSFLVDRWRLKVERRHISKRKIAAEIARFKQAVALCEQQLLGIRERIAQQAKDKTYTYIIDVHLLILEDKELMSNTINLIKKEQVNAEWALCRVLAKFTAIFDNIGDRYLRERKGDIQHVGERIIINLAGDKPTTLAEIEGKAIVIAHDLTPADTAHMYKGKVTGFATDIGGKTSHTAIIARSLEIPAVVALENISSQIETGDPLILDGNEGIVIIKPSKEVFIEYNEKRQKYLYFERELHREKSLQAETIDGYRLEVAANIEFPQEITAVLDHGAEGIGLYRTEYLYLNRTSFPSEEEQFEAYKTLAMKISPYTAIIRTLDIGGDKINPSLGLTQREANPALGLRAIRLTLKQEQLLKGQLQAILRASAYGKLRILLPLVSGINELRVAKKILAEVKEQLQKENIPYDEEIELGVMIEVPSAAMTADQLAQECDFFSIGTNDLIQYLIAIDRGNEQVAYLYEPFHPAILRTVKSVIAAAHNEGIWVGMCGEMAGDPLCTPLLLGLEIDEISMNAVSIPLVKKIIRSITLEEAANITYKALTFATAEEVKGYVTQEMRYRFPFLFI